MPTFSVEVITVPVRDVETSAAVVVHLLLEFL